MIREPEILEPAGLTSEAGWAECRRFVDECGGVVDAEGEVNWRAAFGADPGVCSCPACGEMFWRWGTRQRCTECGFEYPTDWWPMYSYGVSAAKNERLRFRHDERLAHAYYRYGFEHPIDDAWRESKKIRWPEVLSGPAEAAEDE